MFNLQDIKYKADEFAVVNSIFIPYCQIYTKIDFFLDQVLNHLLKVHNLQENSFYSLIY